MSALEQPRWKSDRVEFQCGTCGDSFDVSIRYAREIRRLNLAQTCQPCRIPMQIVVTDVLMEWWVENYSPEEIVELAEGLYGYVGEPSNNGLAQTGLLAILSAAAEEVSFPDH